MLDGSASACEIVNTRLGVAAARSMNVVRSGDGGVGSREVLAATMQANCETIDDGGDVVVPAVEERRVAVLRRGVYSGLARS